MDTPYITGAYIIRRGPSGHDELLMIENPDHPDAPAQIPSVIAEQTHWSEDALNVKIREQTGLRNLHVLRNLGPSHSPSFSTTGDSRMVLDGCCLLLAYGDLLDAWEHALPGKSSSFRCYWKPIEDDSEIGEDLGHFLNPRDLPELFGVAPSWDVPTPDPIPANYKSVGEAIRIYCEHTDSSMYPASEIVDRGTYWYFPCIPGNVGISGYIISKTGGTPVLIGSSTPPPSCFWAYEKGILSGPCDLIVTKVHEMDNTIDCLSRNSSAIDRIKRRAPPSQHFSEWREILGVLPATVFKSADLYFDVHDLMKLEQRCYAEFQIQRSE